MWFIPRISDPRGQAPVRCYPEDFCSCVQVLYIPRNSDPGGQATVRCTTARSHQGSQTGAATSLKIYFRQKLLKVWINLMGESLKSARYFTSCLTLFPAGWLSSWLCCAPDPWGSGPFLVSGWRQVNQQRENCEVEYNVHVYQKYNTISMFPHQTITECSGSTNILPEL